MYQNPALEWEGFIKCVLKVKLLVHTEAIFQKILYKILYFFYY